MKYMYYLFVLLTVVVRRLVFPLIYIAIPFRSRLNNIVFNYHLQNGIKLKRLEERNPVRVSGGWKLGNIHSPVDGFISNNKISKLSYYVALPFWLLLDSDANDDTFDKGFNNTIVNGERKKWMPVFINHKLYLDVLQANSCNLIGNTFDLGDKRSEQPLYGFWSVFWWTLRNPAYNFNYKFNQKAEGEHGGEFQIVIFGRLIGWKNDGIVNGVQYYSWELGKKIK